MNEKEVLQERFKQVMEKQFPQFPPGSSQYQMMWMGWIGGVIAVTVDLEDGFGTPKSFQMAAAEWQDGIAADWNATGNN